MLPTVEFLIYNVRNIDLKIFEFNNVTSVCVVGFALRFSSETSLGKRQCGVLVVIAGATPSDILKIAVRKYLGSKNAAFTLAS